MKYQALIAALSKALVLLVISQAAAQSTPAAPPERSTEVKGDAALF